MVGEGFRRGCRWRVGPHVVGAQPNARRRHGVASRDQLPGDPLLMGRRDRVVQPGCRTADACGVDRRRPAGVGQPCHAGDPGADTAARLAALGSVCRRIVPAGTDWNATLRGISAARGNMASYICDRRQQLPDQHHMGTTVKAVKTSPASGDAFTDMDAFVDAVLVELVAIEAYCTRPTRSRPRLPFTGAALRKANTAIWCVAFCGMQWRAIGLPCGVRFNTLYTVRQLGPALVVAPAAQPPDPDLATSLRRHFRSQRRHHRQPVVSLRADLLQPRLRRRQENEKHQGAFRG
jgi:hypothetical protein